MYSNIPSQRGHEPLHRKDSEVIIPTNSKILGLWLHGLECPGVMTPMVDAFLVLDPVALIFVEHIIRFQGGLKIITPIANGLFSNAPRDSGKVR